MISIPHSYLKTNIFYYKQWRLKVEVFGGIWLPISSEKRRISPVNSLHNPLKIIKFIV